MNIKDLAKILNVSPSTISKAFRNSYDISAETRERILAKAKELNFQPNAFASSLRTQKTKTIAVVLPEIANNFFTLVINGIEAVAQKQGYHVLIYITHEDAQKEKDFITSLQSGRVDGVLISLSQGTTDSSHLLELQEKGIPVVYFDRVLENIDAIKVTTNDFESGYAATEHLIQQGCKKIAHLLFHEHLSISEKRKMGYLQALSDYDYVMNPDLIITCTGNHNMDYKIIKELLSATALPDGIFSSIEKLAILSYEVCNDLDINIPEKIKIITFSNLETASLLNPSLTTMTQPAYEIGEKAATILFNLLTKKNPASKNDSFILKSSLIKRNSTSIN